METRSLFQYLVNGRGFTPSNVTKVLRKRYFCGNSELYESPIWGGPA